MSEQFFEKVDKMFEEKLGYDEIPAIKIKDISKNEILENIDYKNLIRFDSLLNIYKLQKDGLWTIVNNPNFKAVIGYREIFKNK
jgi:hypothetical protein